MACLIIALVSSELSFFFFNDTATTEIYTLSLHDALPISSARGRRGAGSALPGTASPHPDAGPVGSSRRGLVRIPLAGQRPGAPAHDRADGRARRNGRHRAGRLAPADPRPLRGGPVAIAGGKG